jgi:hypothetical protein
MWGELERRLGMVEEREREVLLREARVDKIESGTPSSFSSVSVLWS